MTAATTAGEAADPTHTEATMATTTTTRMPTPMDGLHPAGHVVDRWNDRVRHPHPGEPRKLLSELRVSMEAQAKLREDTTDMQSVFELLQNFPVVDLLRWHTLGRNRFVRSPALRALYHDRSMPDLTDAAAARLLSLPEGTVGREYAEFIKGWRLDNQFLDDWEIEDIGRYFAFRTAHVHDLLHWILGYLPFQHSGEMEIEAFLYAQTGGLNHLLFIGGFARRLRRQHPAELRRILPRLKPAYERGKRCGNVMLVRWEDQLERPVDEVRAELGIDDRPALPRTRITHRAPTESPRIAHVVLNTPDLDADADWFSRVFDLEVTARDDRLGAVFMSDGSDHHTVALARSWGRGLRGKLRGALADVGAARTLIRARRHGRSSVDGRRPTMPPTALIREHLHPGIGHIGYRVSSMEELEAWFHRLDAEGVEVDWMVNHHDMISGIYFLTPSGVRFEIFADGHRAKEKLAAAEAGADRAELVESDFHNWDLDLEAWPR